MPKTSNLNTHMDVDVDCLIETNNGSDSKTKISYNEKDRLYSIYGEIKHEGIVFYTTIKTPKHLNLS